MVNERIQKLRDIMKEKNIDAYYIPTSDFHNSEYVSDYFKTRAYMSNFYGSAGFLLITQKEACLWTDARYFIIAANAIKDNEVKLMKMFEPNVPTLDEYIESHLDEIHTLGFDGRVVSANQMKHFKDRFDINFKCDEDLVDLFWTDRPELSKNKAFFMSEEYAGKSTNDKLKDIRHVMKENKADVHVLSTLDDIAWLMNMRGMDVHCCPVVLSYAVIFMDKVALFMDESKCDEAMLENFKTCNITVYPYNDVYKFLKACPSEYAYMVNESIVNSYLLECIPGTVINHANPSTMMKAKKNPVEIENTRWAHIMDGVAVTKFMIWVKDEIKNREISELEIDEKITSLRKEWKDLITPSFGTIAGYGPNGASMHYSATNDSYSMCKAKDFLLVDSGGTYKQGTTDITRTFLLGETSHAFKEDYTMVLRAHIALNKAKFLYGSSGPTLDGLCRQPFWERGLDYKHGTGHGVGHVLNVHEGPNNFYWNTSRGLCVFEEGMITTNEPGYYVEGSHGIRIENELLCLKDFVNEYGQFMKFESLTICPYDLDAVLVDQFTSSEKAWLNAYHKECYEKLSPYLNEYEKEQLKEYTREI